MSKAARKKRQRALRDGVIVKPEPNFVVVTLKGSGLVVATAPRRWAGDLASQTWKPVDPEPEPVVIDPKELKRQELRDELRRLFEKRRKQGYRSKPRRSQAPMMPRISYLTQQLRELRF